MQKKNVNHEAELAQLYSCYEKKIFRAKNLEKILEIGFQLQRDMEQLNITYGFWDDSKGYDHDSIYFTAAFIEKHCSLPEILALDLENEERRKKQLSDLLFSKIDRSRKKMIHIIEPHPDDALGVRRHLVYAIQQTSM